MSMNFILWEAVLILSFGLENVSFAPKFRLFIAT